MKRRIHASSWRSWVANAPLISAALVIGVYAQAEPQIFVMRNVYFVLVPVCLVGWWMAWQLGRALSDTPLTSVAQAQAGYVSLRGRAQAMPNQPPLTSPSGTPCVWYYYRPLSKHSSAIDSAQPFLLVDGSGECIVLPAGAEITGGEGAGTNERMIVAGDTISVSGEFRPVSSDTLQQIRDVEPEQSTTVSVSFAADDTTNTPAGWDGKQMLKEAQATRAAASDARAAINRSAPPALPLVCAPKNHSPFVISANEDGSNDGSWYRLIANANLILLLGSGAMLSYLMWIGR